MSTRGFEQPADNYRRDPPVVWPESLPSGTGSEVKRTH